MKMVLIIITLCFLPLGVWADEDGSEYAEPFEYFGVQFGDSYEKVESHIEKSEKFEAKSIQPDSFCYQAYINYGHINYHQGSATTRFFFYKGRLVAICVDGHYFWKVYRDVAAMSPNESEMTTNIAGRTTAVFRIRKGLVITVEGNKNSTAWISYSTKEFHYQDFLKSIGVGE